MFSFEISVHGNDPQIFPTVQISQKCKLWNHYNLYSLCEVHLFRRWHIDPGLGTCRAKEDELPWLRFLRYLMESLPLEELQKSPCPGQSQELPVPILSHPWCQCRSQQKGTLLTGTACGNALCYDHVQLRVLSGHSSHIAALQLNSGRASLTLVTVTQIYLR